MGMNLDKTDKRHKCTITAMGYLELQTRTGQIKTYLNAPGSDARHRKCWPVALYWLDGNTSGGSCSQLERSTLFFFTTFTTV